MAAPSRLRFFPSITAPPLTNGNGAKAVATQAKAASVSGVRLDFFPIDSVGHTTLDLSPVGGVSSDLAWYRVSWLAYACMRYRATKLVEAPLWIAEEKDGKESWLEGTHPLEEVLERPNADMEMADLLERTSLFQDSTGACIWVKSRDRGNRVGALYPFSADQFQVESAGGRLYGRYRVKTSEGERVYEAGSEAYPLEDVILFGSPDPADPLRFVSPLHAALARLGIDRTLVQSIVSGLQNAVVNGLTITFPENVSLSPEQQAEFKASLAAQYTNARNHARPLVLGGGATAAQNTLGFSGLEGGELAKEIETAVCACFQTPPVIIGAYVGLANSSDRHNYETAVSAFYDNAILPAWSRIEKTLTRGLLRPVDANPLRFIRFDKAEIKALQVDRVANADVIQKAGRALTVNDARALLDLAPLEDPRGEELMSSGAPVAPGTAPEAAPVKRGGGRLERKGISDDDLRRLVFDEVTRAQEFGWETAALLQLDADRTACLSLAEQTLRTGVKDDDPYAPASAESVRELIARVAEHMDMTAALQWRTRMEPLVESTARRAVQRIATEIGIRFDLLQPGLLQYVEKEAAWLVTQVTDTTKQGIRDAMAAGLAEGESIPQLTARIQEAGAFANSRATLIARTETTRVTNGGQAESLSAYQAESGDRITKRWLNSADERVRDEHREPLNGEVRNIDEPFSNGLQVPGEPNCRCTLVYALEG